jgi:hypothetical protein
MVTTRVFDWRTFGWRTVFHLVLYGPPGLVGEGSVDVINQAEQAYAELKKAGYKGTNKGHYTEGLGVNTTLADQTWRSIQHKMLRLIDDILLRRLSRRTLRVLPPSTKGIKRRSYSHKGTNKGHYTEGLGVNTTLADQTWRSIQHKMEYGPL